MTSPVQLVRKLDDFEVNDSISELAFLTNSLLQLQHARYPHLVPMYRTVHRKIPRPMVFRAIRWVNPKRMFPGAGQTKEEMSKMSSEELAELIVKLNDYRGEAHVIHNRYNEMLDMIEMGELPYYIPYAGFKQDKWTMLQEYKDRALRLKDGTEDWENTLDQQAADIRSILLNREGKDLDGNDDSKWDKMRLDDIDGLWMDANGNPAAPNFYNPKKGRGKKQFIRKLRNGQLIDPPKVYARRYIAVPTAEVRKGEEIRMPAGGQVRRPRNRRERRIFDEFGGAAEHLLRMPRGPFLGSDAQLRERGNLISMPAGRENPLIVTYSEVTANQVANRRVARWTQPDPLGKRGQARHRGEASAATGGHEAEQAQQPAPPWAQPGTASAGLGTGTRAGADIANVEENIRDAGRGMPEQSVKSKIAQQQAEQDSIIAQNDGERFIFRDANQLDLREITADDVVSIMPMSLDDNGNPNGDRGIGAWTTFRVKLTDGSTIVYKQVEGEAAAETFTTTVDRILGLNVTAGSANNILGMQAIFGKLGGKTDPQELQDFAFEIHDRMNANAYDKKSFDQWEREMRMDGRKGVGHVMEFCQPDCTTMRGATNNQLADLAQDFDKRQGIHKIALLDFITGNRDRHDGNYMITANSELVAIDNGFAGGANPYTKNWNNDSNKFLWSGGPAYGNAGNVIDARGILDDGGGDRNIAKVEAMDLFDAQFTQDALDTIINSGQIVGFDPKTTDLAQIRANFEKFVDRIY